MNVCIQWAHGLPLLSHSHFVALASPLPMCNEICHDKTSKRSGCAMLWNDNLKTLSYKSMSRFSDFFPSPHRHTRLRTQTSVPTPLILSLVLLFCSVSLRHHYHFSISLGCLSNRTYHITHIILEIVLHFRVSPFSWVWARAWMWERMFGFHVWMITFICHINTHIDFMNRDEKNALRCIEPNTHTCTSSTLAIVGKTYRNTENDFHTESHSRTYTLIHPQRVYMQADVQNTLIGSANLLEEILAFLSLRSICWTCHFSSAARQVFYFDIRLLKLKVGEKKYIPTISRTEIL